MSVCVIWHDTWFFLGKSIKCDSSCDCVCICMCASRHVYLQVWPMVANFGQLLLAFSALCGAGSWPKLLIEPNRQCATGRQVASSLSSALQRAVWHGFYYILLPPSFTLTFAFAFAFYAAKWPHNKNCLQHSTNPQICWTSFHVWYVYKRQFAISYACFCHSPRSCTCDAMIAAQKTTVNQTFQDAAKGNFPAFR